MENKKAFLVLEDGTSFAGEAFGVLGEACGPVILNTAVVGYQEMMTDPANAGKILVLTYPLIGNYGVNKKFNESSKAWVGGLVIKEDSQVYSNWQANAGLDQFLKEERIPAISGIDTRTLAIKIRDDGEMLGIISSSAANPEDLLSRLKQLKKNESALKQISVGHVTRLSGKKQTVVVIDLGISKSMLKQLSGLGLKVILVPYDAGINAILKLKPKGVIISNGPEEDPGLSKAVTTIKEIIGKIPILGVSTGHQVLAKALGARLTRMKLGHHGVNYPVKGKDSFKGEITVQNHSWVVEEKSLNQKDVQIVERNLNDNTIEKLRSKKLKFISIQYYPTSPGMGEIHPVFGEFVEMMKK
ncbi:MAG: glutamine-hydrolyzing carbamoyl-phosphate synthase small subunit [Candidatus Omnitrophota bacterium]